MTNYVLSIPAVVTSMSGQPPSMLRGTLLLSSVSPLQHLRLCFIVVLLCPSVTFILIVLCFLLKQSSKHFCARKSSL